MSGLMDAVRHWIQLIMETLGYPGIALIMLAENLFPPIPSELVMPLAGFLIVNGSFNFPGAIAAGTLGSVAGAIVLYYIGQLAGEPLVRPFIRNYGRWFLLSEADLDKSLEVFTRHGDIMVFTGRVIPLIRSLISLPAGMNRMPFPRFLFLTTLGSVIWTTLLTTAGYILGRNWVVVVEFISDYQKVVLGLLAVGLIFFVVRRVMALRAAGELQPEGRQVEAAD
jgi:membrane protein DedA with SNARE-associated domain